MLKRMMKDCIPTIIALTFTGLYSVIDGLFIGAAVGDVGLAAINLAWPIPALLTAIGLGIGTGGSILYSNIRGKGEGESGKKVIQITLILLVGVSLFIMLALLLTYEILLRLLGAEGEALLQAKAYCRVIVLGSLFQISGAGIVPLLRNLSRPFQAMFAMICGMLVNCSLNYYFMMRCKLGIRGAALGTIVAQLLVCSICLIEIGKTGMWGKSRGTAGTTLDVRRAVLDIFKTGLPAFGVSMAPTVVLIFTNWQCLRFGGEQAVAAYAVISYIVFPIQSLLQGVGDGLQPLMSYYVGARQNEELDKLKRYAYEIIGVLGFFSFLVSYFMESRIEAWFHLSEKTAEYFCQGFLISAVSFLFYGYSKFHISYLNSHLKVKEAGSFIYGECLVVAPILIFGLPFLWGMVGVWLSLPLSSVVMLIIYFIIKRRNGRYVYEAKDEF